MEKNNNIVENLKFVDLGLPSGKLWATENIKDEDGNEVYFSFDKAVETFGKNLPSEEDWKELVDNCSYKWNKKKKGIDITGSNGNSIFLPAAGYRGGVSVNDVGSHGYYWSSSFLDEYAACYAGFRSDDLYPQGGSSRSYGFSVRLVR